MTLTEPIPPKHEETDEEEDEQEVVQREASQGSPSPHGAEVAARPVSSPQGEA